VRFPRELAEAEHEAFSRLILEHPQFKELTLNA
jgi:hypothetical protein